MLQRDSDDEFDDVCDNLTKTAMLFSVFGFLTPLSFSIFYF
jgi:hypothetical protein